MIGTNLWLSLPDTRIRCNASSIPTLGSRFTTTIAFTGYTVDELVQIADIMAADTGNALHDDARRALGNLLAVREQQGELESPSFGDARFVRTLIENAARQRDLRLFPIPGGTLPGSKNSPVSPLTMLTPQQ